MATMDELAEEHAKRRAKALAMGGAEKLAKRRAEGALNARERLGALLDADSFVESGLFAVSMRAEMREVSAADAKIAGFGRIDGRRVAVVSNDFTVLGASSSSINGKKIRHVKKAGARMPDRMGATGRAILGQDPEEYLRVRKTPWVSAVLGPCYGSSTWYSCISDFVVMRKGALMSVASSRVTAVAIGKHTDSEELGGWRLHATTTGLIDTVAEDDADAISQIRRFLSYLPSHSGEAAPRVTPVPPADPAERILEVLPESRHKTYDVRGIIKCVVDAGSEFELKPRFGRSICTTLARIEGRSVGILASNPYFKGGAIDVDACRKAISFMVLCDSFNVPLVFLVDQPGFLIGLEGELRGAPGFIMNWMNAISLVTVPKISVVMRKSYGQAYLNMGGGRNSDEVAVWPMADLGFVDPAVGVSILYKIKRADDPERFDQLAAELARDSSAWELAALYEAQTVLDPRDTRGYLADMLDIHGGNGVGRHLLANWPTSF